MKPNGQTDGAKTNIPPIYLCGGGGGGVKKALTLEEEDYSLLNNNNKDTSKLTGFASNNLKCSPTNHRNTTETPKYPCHNVLKSANHQSSI